jgi:hypothetical protein
MNISDRERLEKKLDSKFKYFYKKIDEKFEKLDENRIESSISNFDLLYIILGLTPLASVFLALEQLFSVTWLAIFVIITGLL